MKPNLKLLLAVAAAVGAALAVAQDKAPPPQPPSTPPPAPANAPKPANKPANTPATAGRHEHFHHPDGAWQERWREENRGPDGAEGFGHFQHPPLPLPKPVPYIGVITTSVPPILAAQLGLPEDFGLVVEGVLPNSPAATAGLKRFDVLKLYNDQQIVDARQLQILVRATGKDGSATLTVIRKAKEEKITVKIGEHPLALSMHGFHHPQGPGQAPDHQCYAQAGAKQAGEHHPGPEQGLGHPGFDHQRFAGHHDWRHGPEDQRFSREGFDHHSFNREEWRHHGFGHHGFGHHGFGREGFDRLSSHHHGFGREGFDRQNCEQDGFHHRGFGHERFAHNFGDHQRFEHGPAHQWPDQSGGEHRQAPFDRDGRQPSPNRGPGSENRNHDFQGRPEGWHRPSADVEQSQEQPPLSPVEPANILHEIRPGGAAEIRVEHPEGSVVYDTANARVLFSDAAGKIEIAVKDGQRTLLATNTQGETVFEGPIETPEQLNNVPEDIRKKLDWIESRMQKELVDAPAPVTPLKGELIQPELAGALVQ